MPIMPISGPHHSKLKISALLEILPQDVAANQMACT